MHDHDHELLHDANCVHEHDHSAAAAEENTCCEEHAHTHSHEEGHEHVHTHEHTHSHEHTHEHTHADGTVHTHEHSHEHSHPHEHTHSHGDAEGFDSIEQAMALMGYMLEHNRHHAEELHDLAHSASPDAAALIHEAVDAFLSGNEKLEKALAILKEE